MFGGFESQSIYSRFKNRKRSASKEMSTNNEHILVLSQYWSIYFGPTTVQKWITESFLHSTTRISFDSKTLKLKWLTMHFSCISHKKWTMREWNSQSKTDINHERGDEPHSSHNIWMNIADTKKIFDCILVFPLPLLETVWKTKGSS